MLVSSRYLTGRPKSVTFLILDERGESYLEGGRLTIHPEQRFFLMFGVADHSVKVHSKRSQIKGNKRTVGRRWNRHTGRRAINDGETR